MMFEFRKFLPTWSIFRVKRFFRDPFKPVRTFTVVRDTAQASCKTVDKQEDFKQNVVSFNDTKSAYRSKTTREIVRALFVFRLCSNNFLVDNNLKVSEICCNLFIEHRQLNDDNLLQIVERRQK